MAKQGSTREYYTISKGHKQSRLRATSSETLWFGEKYGSLFRLPAGKRQRPTAYPNNRKVRPWLLKISTFPCSRSPGDERSGCSYGTAALELALIQPCETLISVGACKHKHNTGFPPPHRSDPVTFAQ